MVEYFNQVNKLLNEKTEQQQDNGGGISIVGAKALNSKTSTTALKPTLSNN